MFRAAFAAACCVSTAAAAHAFVIPATLPELDGPSAVSVSFVSSSAGARGSLYFLGYETPGGPPAAITPAADSDSNNLGAFLFENKGPTRSNVAGLGVIPGGATLHFAYLVTQGVSVAPTGSLFRTDVAADLNYFGSTDLGMEDGERVWRMGIEDIRDENRSDWDYNDAVFEVRAFPVPTPGTIALAAAGVGLAAVRRRKG